MSERTVADDTLTPGASTTCWEPTGWADAMYSVTTALRMAALRASSAPCSGARSSVRLSSVVGMDLSRPRRNPQARGSGQHQVRFVLALQSSEC
jgi:hypothetical protein